MIAFWVNPSRSLYLNATPAPSVLPTTGPEAAARTPTLAVVGERDRRGRPPVAAKRRPAVDTLITPPSALRPNSALCGPRTNSI